MKYKIVNSDLFINNKLHPEGSEIDLTKEQIKGIEDFLTECHSEQSEESFSKSHPELIAVHPEQIYAENSRSSKGSETKVTQTKNKRNKK